MINFTVGPVQSTEEVRKIGAENVPYFRTQEFSEIMFENERLMKKFAFAEENAKVVFLTGSGTASMEAAVMNVLTKNDKALIINGGSFGQRFVNICKIHKIPYYEIKLEAGQNITQKELKEIPNEDFSALLVNANETSTGVHYDLQLLSDFCKEHSMTFIVDAISSFLADIIDMKTMGIDVLMTGSQKALACPPGISVMVLSEKAVNKIYANEVESLYFDLKPALEDAKRGQTPFTPAVGILLQINARLKAIDEAGGVEAEHRKIAALADDFRNKIKGMPFEIFTEALSPAVTPVRPTSAKAYDIFLTLKDEYGIWICPNGGELSDIVFRVGHIGDLTIEDNDKLIEALQDMQKRGLV